MTQIGFPHVPDGVDMNLEQAMPDCFENHHKYVGKCPYCHTALPETAMPLETVSELTRDIYEVANQLEGYVSTSTPERLAVFLLREGKEAAKLADEIVRLRAALEQAKP